MSYYELDNRDFFRVVNARLEREMKRARKLRRRKVRRWMLRRTWHQVRRGRVAWLCLCIWTLVAAQWLWMRVVVPVIQG